MAQLAPPLQLRSFYPKMTNLADQFQFAPSQVVPPGYLLKIWPYRAMLQQVLSLICAKAGFVKVLRRKNKFIDKLRS